MVDRPTPEIAWASPDELVEAVRAGRIRFPVLVAPAAQEIVRVLDGLYRGYPQPLVVTWVDPRSDPEQQWVIDGGTLLAVAMVAVGDLAARRDEGPVIFDADTGEIATSAQRPDRDHALLDALELLAADDPADQLESRTVTGPRADRAHQLRRALSEPSVPVRAVRVGIDELPRVLDHLAPGRQGVRLGEITGTEDDTGTRTPPASFFAWRDDLGHLGYAAGGTVQFGEEAIRRAVVVAEGRDPDSGFDGPFADRGKPAVRAVRAAQRVLRDQMLMPAGRLSVAEPMAALARFLRIFPDIDDTWRLVRRWIWRLAISDGAIDLSPERLSAIRGDARSSILRLLDRTPAPPSRSVGRAVIDADTRAGRMALVGMAGLHPRDVSTGLLVDVEQTRPQEIVQARPAELANLVLHGYAHRTGHLDLRAAIAATTDPELLASHGIDAEAHRMLRIGDDEGFLARRAAILDEAIAATWAEFTEPGASVRTPIGSLFEDDRAG